MAERQHIKGAALSEEPFRGKRVLVIAARPGWELGRRPPVDESAELVGFDGAEMLIGLQ
ncbi:MAG: hypothetical protein ACRDWD_02005 [Acidimicrobiia bacterium]